jgi:hypothetical protein
LLSEGLGSLYPQPRDDRRQREGESSVSTISGYHDPEGPMPDERDPTPEEMKEAFPFEERLLDAVRQLQVAILARFPLGKDLDNAMSLCRFLKSQLKQAIADRDAPDERDYDPDFADPFGDDV